MEIILMVLVLLSTVVVSTFCTRLLPVSIPAPLLQIAIGALLYYCGYEIEFDSHLFLMLFIPPLLFLDGWRIPKGAFFRDWRPILALAVGLVVFTVVGIGYFVHWLIPTVPLSVAFALAAILSPTDPVAVGAMTSHTPLPSRLMHILEGEALLNDATGLVCFSFAVAAVMTGKFSLVGAAGSFMLVAGGGVIVGIAVTWGIGRLNQLLVRHTGEDPASQILVSLLIPFVAYLVAEQLHASGILAAAVAGMVMHYAELAGRPSAATRMQRNAVWDTVQATLNGIIFVLLGEHLPHVLRSLPTASAEAGPGPDWHLYLYVVMITLGLMILRFSWVWISMRLTILRAARRGGTAPVLDARLLLVTSLAGVRGAITLAGVLTVPLTLLDGSAFPARDIAIFLAMGVILLSLVVASIGVPMFSKDLKADLPQVARRSSEANARLAAAEAAMRKIEQIVAEPVDDAELAGARNEAAIRLLQAYRSRLEYGDPTEEDASEAQLVAATARKLRLQALGAERDELYRVRLARAIDDDVHRQLVREIDLLEASLLQQQTASAH